MPVMHGEEGNFLERLQALPEPVKKKVIIVAAAVLMIVVVYFWLAYFDNLLAGTAPASTVAEDQSGGGTSGIAVQPARAGAGVWQQIGSDIGSIGAHFASWARGLSGILEAPRQYIVNPPR